jgi:hypothetical protein
MFDAAGASDAFDRGSPMPVVVKYALLTVSSGLWLSGLVDQIHSLAAVAKYVGISALMLALALL